MKIFITFTFKSKKNNNENKKHNIIIIITHSTNWLQLQDAYIFLYMSNHDHNITTKEYKWLRWAWTVTGNSKLCPEKLDDHTRVAHVINHGSTKFITWVPELISKSVKTSFHSFILWFFFSKYHRVWY